MSRQEELVASCYLRLQCHTARAGGLCSVWCRHLLKRKFMFILGKLLFDRTSVCGGDSAQEFGKCTSCNISHVFVSEIYLTVKLTYLVWLSTLQFVVNAVVVIFFFKLKNRKDRDGWNSRKREKKEGEE